MNGIIIVNKEKGFTSHDVVAKLRGILRFKKIGCHGCSAGLRRESHEGL